MHVVAAAEAVLRLARVRSLSQGAQARGATTAYGRPMANPPGIPARRQHLRACLEVGKPGLRAAESGVQNKRGGGGHSSSPGGPVPKPTCLPLQMGPSLPGWVQQPGAPSPPALFPLLWTTEKHMMPGMKFKLF